MPRPESDPGHEPAGDRIRSTATWTVAVAALAVADARRPTETDTRRAA